MAEIKSRYAGRKNPGKKREKNGKN